MYVVTKITKLGLVIILAVERLDGAIKSERVAPRRNNTQDKCPTTNKSLPWEQQQIAPLSLWESESNYPSKQILNHLLSYHLDEVLELRN